jgi:hypothetical protein
VTDSQMRRVIGNLLDRVEGRPVVSPTDSQMRRAIANLLDRGEGRPAARPQAHSEQVPAWHGPADEWVRYNAYALIPGMAPSVIDPRE